MRTGQFSLVQLMVLGLAAYYVTYVVTQSDFPPIERVRIAVFKHWGEGSWQAYLAVCGWCVSAYSSALVVGSSALVVGVPMPVMVWLAVAAISGTLILLINRIADSKASLLNKQFLDAHKPTIADRIDQAITREMDSRGGA